MDKRRDNNKIMDGIRKFLLSDWMIYFTAALVYVGWLSGLWMIFMAVLFIVMATILVLCEDTTPVLAPLFMFTMLISSRRGELWGSAWMLWLIVLPVGALVYHTIKHRNKLSLIAPKRWSGFALSLVLLIIPMSLGGIFRSQRNPLVALAVPALTLLIAAFYLFFTMTADKKEGRVQKYVLKIVFATSILVSAELITAYAGVIIEGGGGALINYIRYKNLSLGWAGANNVAPVLAMTMPVGLYYSLRKSKGAFVYIIIALVQYLLVVSTGSRGTILLLTLAMPFMLFYIMAQTANKMQTGLSVSFFFAIAVIGAAYFAPQVLSAFSETAGRGLSDNGRFDLYSQAIDAFAKHPIFGAGWDYRLGELYGDGTTPFWYHSTALQILANMGIVGGLFFGYLYFWRYRTLLTSRTPANLALFVGVLLFDLYGMIDVGFFGPTFFIMMAVMTFAVESTLQDRQIKPKLVSLLDKKTAKIF